MISTFVVHCLDSIIPLVSISGISGLCLASVAAQAGLSLPWSQTPVDRFSHDKAKLCFHKGLQSLINVLKLKDITPMDACLLLQNLKSTKSTKVDY